MASGMFAFLALTTHQRITGSVIVSMFSPCMAAFVVLLRELKIRDGLKAVGIMLFTILLVGTAVNFFLD